MTIDGNIRDEKLQYDLTEKQQKHQHYYLEKSMKMNIFQVKTY